MLHVVPHYARNRLKLGIYTVGFWVVLSTLALIWKSLWLPSLQQVGNISSVLLFVGAYITLSIPFDVQGGYVLPYRYGRGTIQFREYLNIWFRGALAHGSFLAVFAGFMLWFYHLPAMQYSGSWMLVLVASLLIQLFLLMLQPVVARLLANFHVEPNTESRFSVWDCPDIGFTGGLPLTGERSILPKRWVAQLLDHERILLDERRQYIRQSSLYPLGIIGALALNTIGALLAHAIVLKFQWLPGLIGPLPFLILWASVATLWGFAGLVLLPPISQMATLKADRVWKNQPSNTVEQLVVHLDTLQDEEYRRAPLIQQIFHPIASVEQRMNVLQAQDYPRGFAAYHLARLCLYLSWSNLSLVSRAVHCNVGRPHLWVFLPCDG
jgi:hypothetical protein